MIVSQSNPSVAVPAATASVPATAGVCAAAGNLGGAPPVVTQDNSARPFSVNGSTFLNKAAACGRACDIQHKYVTTLFKAKIVLARMLQMLGLGSRYRTVMLSQMLARKPILRSVQLR